MVVRREYLQSVQQRAFWIGTLAFPLLMVLMFALPIFLSKVNPEQQKKIVIIDATGRLAGPVETELSRLTLKNGQPEFVVETSPSSSSPQEARQALEPRVLEGEIYGILAVGDNLEADDNYRVYLKYTGDVETIRKLENAIESAVVGARLEASAIGLDRATLDSLMAPIDLKSFQVSASGEARERGFVQVYIATYAFVFLLYFMLYFYGFSMTRGILQEKSNKIMEVLLGSMTSDQLMTGKILGIGLVGLTQVVIYMVTAGVLRVLTLSRSGRSDVGDVLSSLTPSKLIYFALFYVLGYFMFTSMFAVVGAVCKTEQETVYFQMPVLMGLLIPLLTTVFFVKHPDSTAAVVLSLIPLFTPMLMFMRISVLTPPFWQIALSVVLMIGTIFLLFRGAAKVFRVGMLMQGKRPTIPEILRWARG